MNNKKKSENLVLGVVYASNEPFFKNYFDSITGQDYKDFDLLIIDDDYGIDDRSLPPGTICKKVSCMTPLQIRLMGIDYARENDYRNLIFTDSDDYFSSNRLEATVGALENFDFVYNDISIVDIAGNTLKERMLQKINVPAETSSLDSILDRNYIGLSNSGVRVAKIGDLKIPEGIIAVDWWIYSNLLIKNLEGKFVSEAVTFYRQGENNLVGMGNKTNAESIKKILNVKKIHYFELLKVLKSGELYDKIKIKLDEINGIGEKLNDSIFMNKYINVINNYHDNIYRGWWSELLTFSEWDMNIAILCKFLLGY